MVSAATPATAFRNRAVGFGGIRVGQPLLRSVQDASQVVRVLNGIDQVGGRSRNDPAGLGAEVGPDAARVVCRAQPAI